MIFFNIKNVGTTPMTVAEVVASLLFTSSLELTFSPCKLLTPGYFFPSSLGLQVRTARNVFLIGGEYVSDISPITLDWLSGCWDYKGFPSEAL